ncbi:MAG: L-rhamnose/proton symporter RhaT [Rikenellaceae bacterium]
MFEILLGTALIAFGSALSGSFAMPMTRTKGWNWEHSWLAFCLFAYVVFPIVLSFIFAPGFMDVLASQSTSALLWPFILGAMYGVANFSFGLSLKFLGLSLGYSISLGLSMVMGTLIPAILDGRLSIMLTSEKGTFLICGLLTGILGVVISAYSGYVKEKSEAVDTSERNFVKGIAATLFVGVVGSTHAFAIEQGNGIANDLAQAGVDPLFLSVPILIIIFGGSFISTAICCIYLSIKAKTTSAFVCSDGDQRPIFKNYIFCAASGFLWFINFIFYVMGRSRMGEFSFIAWGILMSLTIICGTLWGVYRGEWRNATLNNKLIMYGGLVVLTVASFIIGMSTN